MNGNTQEEANMKRIITGMVMASLLVMSSLAAGQTTEPARIGDQSGQQMQAGPRDHDGDGVPNGMDTDYSGPGKDANKGQKGKGQSSRTVKNGASQAFVDRDGDGVCDNSQDKAKNGNGSKRLSKQGKGAGAGQGLGQGQGNAGKNGSGTRGGAGKAQ